MNTYDVIEDATIIVDSQLELIKELFGSKRTLMESKSKLVCRCRSCRSYADVTLGWVAGFERPARPDAPEPKIRRTRIFPLLRADTSNHESA